jgi:hypothetical protein
LLVAFGLTQNVELLMTQWLDARRDVEGFLRRLPLGTRVETYGLGVYLPRFDLSPSSNYQVTRISGLNSGRTPDIAGLRELKANYADVESRRPDILVLPEGFAGRFRPAGPGSTTPRAAMTTYRSAPGALEFFRRALRNELPGYRLTDVGRVVLPGWYTALGGRSLEVHGSTGRRVWVYQRIVPEHRESPARMMIPW